MMKPKKCMAAALALSFIALAAVTGVRADSDRAAEHLAGAIRFQTISFQDEALVDASTFLAFHQYLADTYPLIHEKLGRETVNDLGLLYAWQGSDPAARPIVLCAHSDVVPIAPGTIQDWTHPPFEGVIAGGFIWGRGTMDDKGSLIAIMEAVEGLLADGFTPRRTVYLAFGQDEEVGGEKGAVAISALLQERGVRAEYVLDESGMIVDGRMLGIAREVAVVGIAEKGYLSLELIARTPGGHSSMPPRETAIGVLAVAIDRLQKHPFPARIDGVTELTLERLAPEMPTALKLAIQNRWLLGPVIEKFLSQNSATDAMIRTTTAPTIIAAGTKENVLPQEAKAVVNFRLLPGDGIQYVIDRVIKVIDDPRVTVAPIGTPREASQISSLESEGFKILEGTINEQFPEMPVIPYLCLGGTDARHYEAISDSVYRFLPMRVGAEDQARAHGTDERVSVDNNREIVDFYGRMIKNSQ